MDSRFRQFNVFELYENVSWATGADAAIAPATRWGYLILNQAASIPTKGSFSFVKSYLIY